MGLMGIIVALIDRPIPTHPSIDWWMDGGGEQGAMAIEFNDGGLQKSNYTLFGVT